MLTGIVCSLAAMPAQARDGYLVNADILAKFCNSPHGAPNDDGI